MNFKEQLFNMPVGAVMSSITRKPGTYDEEVSFIIKESSNVISEIGKAPKIHLRGGIVQNDVTAVMVAMFSFNDIPFKYEAWFNYYSMYGRTAMDRLIKQETILFDCIDVSCNTVQQFRSKNNLAELAQNYIYTSSDYKPWNTHEYNILRKSMYSDGIDKLWDRLCD